MPSCGFDGFSGKTWGAFIQVCPPGCPPVPFAPPAPAVVPPPPLGPPPLPLAPPPLAPPPLAPAVPAAPAPPSGMTVPWPAVPPQPVAAPKTGSINAAPRHQRSPSSRVCLEVMPIILDPVAAALGALQLLRFDAAVLLAALIGVIGGDGVLVAEADGVQPLLVDALRHDVVAARLRTLFRQRLVGLRVPHVVGVARDLHARVLLVDHELDHRIEVRE